jgi:hypothetical protein
MSGSGLAGVGLLVGHGEKEAVRVEPRLGHPLAEVLDGHVPLLGVVGERCCVDREQRFLVLGQERPDPDARRNGDVRDRERRRAAHDPQLALLGDAEPGRDARRRRMVGVRPGLDPVGGAGHRCGKGGADTLAA